MASRKPSPIARRLGSAAMVGLLVVSACSDMTGPSSNDEGSQTVVANGPALGGLISSEMARVMPSITRNASATDLSGSLDELSAALQAGLGNESRAAISRFTMAAEQFSRSSENPDLAAELAALRHAVEVVKEAVEAR